MTDRRPDQQEMSKSKRVKTDGLDPRANPYLAHNYEEESFYSAHNGNGNGARTGLSDFKRHATTAVQAHKAEDGPNNPFNNAPLSKQYFNILKTRRDLPVHKQRCVAIIHVWPSYLTYV
jgi:pre-mRNA-splicing factor ATP-dependent RNA helicase DHX15/PRP43